MLATVNPRKPKNMFVFEMNDKEKGGGDGLKRTQVRGAWATHWVEDPILDFWFGVLIQGYEFKPRIGF